MIKILKFSFSQSVYLFTYNIVERIIVYIQKKFVNLHR